MAKHQSLTRNDSSRLLNSLLDNPALPEYVAQLAPTTLNRLIDHIGPEDAGAIVAYATDRQLRSVLDETLWGSLAPGELEQHRPEEFVRWLFIFDEQGESMLSQRLVGLGLDYAVLNFGQLLRVSSGNAILADDYETIERYQGSEGYAEEFEGYYVSAGFDEEWDITRAALVALQDNAPEFLRHLLSRLALGHAETMMHDVTGERRDGKESEGFVSPESAAAFFSLTRESDLTRIAFGPNLDPVSVRYFSQLGAQTEVEVDRGTVEDVDTDPSPEEGAGQGREDQSGRETRRFADLDSILIAAEVITPGSTLLLSAPEAREELPIKVAIDRLQSENPSGFAGILSELVYLSNLLIAGQTLEGQRFDQGEAARATLAACNFGWSYLDEDISSAVDDGLVRLFRVGWKLLQDVPGHVVAELAATVRSAEFAEKIFDRKWVLDEIDVTFDELAEEVAGRRYGEAKTSLTFISLVLEEEVSDALTRIIADYPRYPLGDTLRYFEHVADIESIAGFVRRLKRSGSD